jgi:hypothetical protein
MKYRQTAVEWLIEQYENGINTVQVDIVAKEMERQQIIEAYDEGDSEWTAIPYKNGNDYYYENFGI